MNVAEIVAISKCKNLKTKNPLDILYSPDILSTLTMNYPPAKAGGFPTYAQEINWLTKTYNKEIDQLKNVYGKDSVTVEFRVLNQIY